LFAEEDGNGSGISEVGFGDKSYPLRAGVTAGELLLVKGREDNVLEGDEW